MSDLVSSPARTEKTRDIRLARLKACDALLAAVCSIVMFPSAWAASDWEKTSRSRRGRANSPDVWRPERHSGNGRTWGIDDDLEVDYTLSNEMEGELDIPSMVVADFMARAWQLVGGCRFYLNGEGGWNLPLCKETQLHGVIDSSLKLNDVISFHHLIQLTVTQQYH